MRGTDRNLLLATHVENADGQAIAPSQGDTDGQDPLGHPLGSRRSDLKGLRSLAAEDDRFRLCEQAVLRDVGIILEPVAVKGSMAGGEYLDAIVAPGRQPGAQRDRAEFLGGLLRYDVRRRMRWSNRKEPRGHHEADTDEPQRRYLRGIDSRRFGQVIVSQARPVV